MRFQYRAAGPIAAALILALLSGCSRTQHDWRVAQAAGTAEAYEAFTARHPHGELAGIARQRIAQLTEEAAWRRTTQANTSTAYQAYLARYPNGSWSQDARIRMESLSMASQAQVSAPAPLPAPAGGTESGHAAPAASRATAAGPPDLRVAPAAGESTTGAAGHFAVQLGAYSSLANANAAWSRLASQRRPQLQGRTARVVPVTVSGRRLYRLEVSVPDRAAARQLCRRLRREGQDCLPVP